MSNDLRFPIGEFDRNFDPSPEARRGRIRTIAELPSKLAKAVDGLDAPQLDTEYRPGGWTVRQTVHHLPDSHANSFIRFKLALTEDEPPTIRPYYEDRWAELSDSKMPVDVSLRLIEAIHERWVTLLEAMSDGDFEMNSFIPKPGNGRSTRPWRCTHGTASTIQLIFPISAHETAGNVLCPAARTDVLSALCRSGNDFFSGIAHVACG